MSLISINTEALTNKIKNPKLWAIIILSILLIGGVAFWWVSRENRHKQALQQRDVLITALNNKWLSCINASADTVYQHVTIVSGPSETVYPKPKRLFGVKYDTIKTDSLSLEKPSSIVTKQTLADECPKGYYNDTLKVGKFTVNWEAIGCIRSFRILNIGLDHNYMIITKQPTIIQYDTIYKEKTPPFFRWGPYTGLTLNSFSKFPGIEIGAQVVVKNQLTISLGGLYLNNLYANLRIGILFK